MPAEKKAHARIRRRFKKLCAFDQEFEAQGFSMIAGVDEAGRGALAGPVVSAVAFGRVDETILDYAFFTKQAFRPTAMPSTLQSIS